MAYNYYPNYYQPMYPQIQPTYQQQPQMQAPQTQITTQPVQQPVQPQIQNGGFISVRSEQEARSYPIAPGNSVTFKDENMPYVYVKTMGFSQLDSPNFEKFRLVKEEEVQAQQSTSGENRQTNNIDYALKADLVSLQGAFATEIETLKKQIANLTQAKKEVESNE